jgi:AhpD family alkylhydroperoxidase
MRKQPSPRLRVTDPNGPGKETGDLMEETKTTFGSIPAMGRIIASSPSVVQGYLAFAEALNRGELSPTLRAQIALVVAEVNASQECLRRHAADSKDLGLIETAIQAAGDAGASNARTEVALRFVRNLVAYRADLTDEERNALKEAGFSDAEIVEIVANVALNIFTNYLNSVVGTESDEVG